MKKTIEAFGTGSSAEEAQKAALVELGAPESADVKTEIIDVQEKKILGLFRGSTVYKARASYEVEVKEEKKPEIKKEVKKETKSEVKKTEEKKSVKSPKEEDDIDAVVTVDADGVAENYIRSIFKGLDIENIHITTTKRAESISFQVECGDDYGCVIACAAATDEFLPVIL